MAVDGVAIAENMSQQTCLSALLDDTLEDFEFVQSGLELVDAGLASILGSVRHANGTLIHDSVEIALLRERAEFVRRLVRRLLATIPHATRKIANGRRRFVAIVARGVAANLRRGFASTIREYERLAETCLAAAEVRRVEIDRLVHSL